ncbi:MAG: orotidine 5'-phosphate decarboxylase [Candidatus Nitrosotenuis sp.]
MTSYRQAIRRLASEKSPLILANDYDKATNFESKTLQNIRNLSRYICAIKMNFHVLLPLGYKQIKKITKTAHDSGLVCIADIKLNDIGNTNNVTVRTLWDMGFDAVIVNPMMGPANLQNLVRLAHKNRKGIISLCHMSSPEAKVTYELPVDSQKTPLYHLFLKWAIKMQTDGIIVGATFPEIVMFCKKKTKNKLEIYSPGIGTQGGDIQKTIAAGSSYLIVGRTILAAKDPKQAAKSLFDLTKN